MLESLIACSTLPAGPTVILQQQYDPSSCRPVPEEPPSSVLVWPLAGNYCLFNGRLGHGVLGSCSGSRRATLLVNWWSQQPQVGGFPDVAVVYI
jgi:hypothetical protein